MDLLYFIDHHIDEAVPDHSTICKTRKRIPQEIFVEVFNHILGLCVASGLVKADIQSPYTAYINANASLDRMVEVKMIDRDPLDYLKEVQAQEVPSDDEIDRAKKRMKKNQQNLERFTEYRRKKYTEQDGGKTHRKIRRRFLSNATHQSLTDPDARVAKKSGKPRMLCYSAAMSVDAEKNVITHISAEHAHKKDSRYLLDITESTLDRLELYGLKVKTLLADAGFSSGENYHVLNEWGIQSYIPIHGGYKEKREGFDYDSRRDISICKNNKELKFVLLEKLEVIPKKDTIPLKKIVIPALIESAVSIKEALSKSSILYISRNTNK